MNPHLGITITTYNFGAFLPAALDSILPEAKSLEVDVLVFDGCSNDNTQAVITSYQKTYRNLRYVRALSKGGIDLDMSLSVAHASSDYCWLLSADDICLKGAVGYILENLKQHQPDLLLTRHNECDFDMRVIYDFPVLSNKIKKPQVYNLADADELSAYCNSAQTLEAFFSFMGTLVVKRKKWFETKLEADAKNNYHAHMTRLWSLTAKAFKLLYCPNVLLNRRGENDSFSQDGMLPRLQSEAYRLPHAVARATDNPVIINNLKRVLKSNIYPHRYKAVKADLIFTKAPQESFDELENILKSLN